MIKVTAILTFSHSSTDPQPKYCVEFKRVGSISRQSDANITSIEFFSSSGVVAIAIPIEASIPFWLWLHFCGQNFPQNLEKNQQSTCLFVLFPR